MIRWLIVCIWELVCLFLERQSGKWKVSYVLGFVRAKWLGISSHRIIFSICLFGCLFSGFTSLSADESFYFVLGLVVCFWDWCLRSGIIEEETCFVRLPNFILALFFLYNVSLSLFEAPHGFIVMNLLSFYIFLFETLCFWSVSINMNPMIVFIITVNSIIWHLTVLIPLL